MKKIFSSSLFLTVCILLTLSAVLDIRRIITVLTAAAVWVIYSDARADGAMRYGGIKFLTVVFRIKYIIAWIVTGLIGLVGAAASAMMFFQSDLPLSLLGSAVDYSADISEGLSDMLARVAAIITLPDSTAAAALLTLALFLLTAVCSAVMNIVFTAYYMKYFEKILYISDKSTLSPEDHSAAAVRMLINGMLTVIPVCIDILSRCLPTASLPSTGFGASALFLGAAYITGYAILKRRINAA